MKTASDFPAAHAHSDSADVDLHSEPLSERTNRNLSDLLQEFRVAGLGVQVSLDFSCPSRSRCVSPSSTERNKTSTKQPSSAQPSTAVLISPVAHHRWVFRRHEKGRLLRLANVLAC